MSPTSLPEVWLRGRIDGYPPIAMPVVHALLQVREEMHRLLTQVSPAQVWERPGGAASIGFHVRHAGGALDRLLTYARGESLSETQLAFLAEEEAPGDALADVAALVDQRIDQALAHLAAVDPATMFEERRVGRAGLPSTVIGLLFHAAEHSTRHLGQAITTARILAGRDASAASTGLTREP